MTQASPLLPPSKALWAAEFPRAAWALATWWRDAAGLEGVARGDGRPILLLPGLFNADLSNLALHRFLDRIDYTVEGWGLGANLGHRTIGPDGEILLERVAAVADDHGEPVTLIGVSLGGIMARFAAHRRPDLVREVITVSSPFAAHPRATNVWRAFEWVARASVDDPVIAGLLAEAAEPLDVPTTAIWSRSDGFVNGHACHDDRCHAIEVSSGHLGVQHRPEVLRAIARVLAGSGSANDA